MNEQSEAAKAKASNGTGHAKFEKVAVARTKAAIRAIRLLTKMGRSKVFEYTSAEADKIATALEAEIVGLRRAMAEPQHQLDIEFDLK